MGGGHMGGMGHMGGHLGGGHIGGGHIGGNIGGGHIGGHIGGGHIGGGHIGGGHLGGGHLSGHPASRGGYSYGRHHGHFTERGFHGFGSGWHYPVWFSVGFYPWYGSWFGVWCPWDYYILSSLGCYILTQESMCNQQELENTIRSLEARVENAEHVAEGLRLVPNMAVVPDDPYPSPKLQWVKPIAE